jgi:hypothetical protein
MEFKELMCEDLDWIHLFEDSVELWRLLYLIMNIQVAQKARNVWLAEQLSLLKKAAPWN